MKAKDISNEVSLIFTNKEAKDAKIKKLLPALEKTKDFYFNQYSLFARSEVTKQLPQELHAEIFSLFDALVMSDINENKFDSHVLNEKIIENRSLRKSL